jgi:predicted alpha/beta hydrolase
MERPTGQERPRAAAEREVAVPAQDGYRLATTVHEPAQLPTGVVVLAGATGVPQRYYAPFARHLAAAGFAVVTFDYRGIGGSRPARLRGFKGGMGDWGERDLAGVIEWVRDSPHGHLPLYFVGHSVGGQILPLAPNAGRFRAAYLVASQSGHWRLWSGLRRVYIGTMWHLGVPLVTTVLGHFPAALLGGGEDLPPQVAKDWARWGRHRRYVLSHRPDTAQRFAAVRMPVRLVSFPDDPIAPPRAVTELATYYANAQVVRREVRPTEIGRDRIGHFGYFRERVGAPLWHDAVAFLEDHA